MADRLEKLLSFEFTAYYQRNQISLIAIFHLNVYLEDIFNHAAV